ncbi:hypothetical protein HAX54_049492 [Datura stramonium]|uniref:Uncharacterized protein n=1 Tax=Datura stramonium TaxID=4076 RepID=A0ABS8RQX4_DATST|nr:hypothetical protein [Datura stramonium]
MEFSGEVEASTADLEMENFQRGFVRTEIRIQPSSMNIQTAPSNQGRISSNDCGAASSVNEEHEIQCNPLQSNVSITQLQKISYDPSIKASNFPVKVGENTNYHCSKGDTVPATRTGGFQSQTTQHQPTNTTNHQIEFLNSSNQNRKITKVDRATENGQNTQALNSQALKAPGKALNSSNCLSTDNAILHSDGVCVTNMAVNTGLLANDPIKPNAPTKSQKKDPNNKPNVSKPPQPKISSNFDNYQPPPSKEKQENRKQVYRPIQTNTSGMILNSLTDCNVVHGVHVQQPPPQNDHNVAATNGMKKGTIQQLSEQNLTLQKDQLPRLDSGQVHINRLDHSQRLCSDQVQILKSNQKFDGGTQNTADNLEDIMVQHVQNVNIPQDQAMYLEQIQVMEYGQQHNQCSSTEFSHGQATGLVQLVGQTHQGRFWV